MGDHNQSGLSDAAHHMLKAMSEATSEVASDVISKTTSKAQTKLSLKNRALYYLSLREHSRLELGRKLVRYAQEGDDVEALLDFLEKAKFLSCERFSESLIRRRSENYGNNRILAELQTHGLNPQLLAQSKTELAESEVTRARAVWEKKFGSHVDKGVFTPEQRAKQIRFLAQRGFSSNAIRIALRGKMEE
jgi:regulatory protein